MVECSVGDCVSDIAEGSRQLHLAASGFGMICTFLVLIMTRRLSVIAGLTLVPIAFGVVAGFGFDMSLMVMSAISSLAPTACALVFAVFYFAIMMDAGLFRPLVTRAVKFSGGDPLKVSVATVLVTIVTSLAGNGATTALVTIGAFLPIYDKLGMNRLNLAVLLATSSAVINLVPWGGTMLRVASGLQIDMMDVFIPLIPTLLVGVAANIGFAVYLGRKARIKLGKVDSSENMWESEQLSKQQSQSTVKFAFNAGLTVMVLLAAITQLVPLPVIFMVGFGLALSVNYPSLEAQKERIVSHAPNVVMIILLVLSASVFTGIFTGTGMVAAMGDVLLTIIPDSMGPYFGFIVALLSGPLTFIMSNDAFYFGIVPLLAEAAQHFGVTSVEIGRASMLGVVINAISPLVAAVYLVAGLLKKDVVDMQKAALPFAVFIYLTMILTALVSGAVPFKV